MSATRRQFLLTTARAGIATTAAGSALALHVTDMAEASPVADPLLDLVQRYEAEERRVGEIPGDDDLTDDEMRHLNELFDELRDDPPRATTMAGAIAALRLAHANMAHLAGGFQRPLVGAAIAFLHGESVR